MKAIPITMMFYLCLSALVACSKGGDDPSPASTKVKDEKSEPVKKAADPIDFSSTVGLSLLQGHFGKALPCPFYEREPKMEVLAPNSFNLDGSFSEWKDLYIVTRDPQNDAIGPDLKTIFLAHVADDADVLAGAVALEGMASTDHVVLEFGIIGTEQTGETTIAKSRMYKLTREGAYEHVDQEWRAIDARVLLVVFGDQGVEWAIEKRQLDGVFGQALWWNKVKVYRNDKESDRTSTTYFHSLDPVRQTEYSLSVCRTETFARMPMRFFQISKKGVSLDDAEHIFDHMRSAYEDMQYSYNYQQLSVSSFATIVTETKPIFKLGEPLEDATIHFDYAITVPLLASLKQQLYIKYFSPLYTSSLEILTKATLVEGRKENTLAEAFKEYFVTQALKRKMTLGDWLAFRNEEVNEFLNQNDDGASVGLFERYQRLTDSFDNVSLESEYRALTKAKAAAWSVLASSLDVRKTAAAWFEKDTTLREAMMKHHGESTDTASLWSGWISSMPYGPQHSPTKLTDLDNDGLPLFLEEFYGTNASISDSDEDGWSDLSEISLNKDPLSRSSRPNTLADDGLITDWQQLLPTRITRHQSTVANSSCGSNAFIDAYAALITKEGLLVSLKMRGDAPDMYQHSWEITVEGASPQDVKLIRAVSGRFGYDMIDPVTLKGLDHRKAALRNMGSTLEWSIPLALVGIDATKISDTRLMKISSIKESARRDLCDETPWFRPFYRLD